MEDMLGQSAQIAALIAAIFFALLAGSSLINLYLRYHDRLSIEKEDMQNLARNSAFALRLMVIAGLFHFLPFFMALGYLLCGVVIFQIFKINDTLKVLRNF